MNLPVEAWFYEWLDRHKRWNRGSGWNSFEADEIAALPWMDAFRRERVAPVEADNASMAMAGEESRFPEHHLHRLLTLIRSAREADPTPTVPRRSAADDEAERRERDSPIVEAEWSRVDEVARSQYRRQVVEASPGLARFPAYVEALAKQVHAESALPAFRPGEGEKATLESLRLAAERPDPGRPRPVIAVAPPELTREQEAELIRQADAKRRSDLARLRSVQPAKTVAP